MNFSTHRPYSGKTPAAFEAIETTLMPNGFRIVTSTADHLKLKGRGLRSSKEDPIRGATEIAITANENELVLNASLNGVRNMALFVIIFPVLMFGGVALVKSFVSSTVPEGELGTALMISAIWVVVGPLVGLWMRHRTIEALHVMMDNAVVRAGRHSAVDHQNLDC